MVLETYKRMDAPTMNRQMYFSSTDIFSTFSLLKTIKDIKAMISMKLEPPALSRNSSIVPRSKLVIPIRMKCFMANNNDTYTIVLIKKPGSYPICATYKCHFERM